MKFKCISCDKKIERSSEGWYRGAIDGRLRGAYGSEHDMEIFHIVICDECIEKKKVLKIGKQIFSSYVEDEIKEKYREL